MSHSFSGRPTPPLSSDTPRSNGDANGYQSSHSHSHTLSVKLPSSSSSSSPIPSPPLSTFSPLPTRIRLAYSVGHVLNDLVASCWFSYLLVFLRTVLLFPSTQAGLLLLIGQISDGLATPVVGFLSDKTDVRFGKRRAWITIGSLIVALSFPPIFHQPFLPWLSLSSSSLTLLVLYYAFFIVIFQWAWASVQVSHLALVPELSRDSNERVYLNSLRSIATILSNVTVFCFAFVILHTCSSAQPIGPDDVGAFYQLAIVVVAVGAVFSLLFVCGVPEPQPRKKREGHKSREWYDWFFELNFYQTMIVYTCTRLMVNVSQTYVKQEQRHRHQSPAFPLGSLVLLCTHITALLCGVVSGTCLCICW